MATPLSPPDGLADVSRSISRGTAQLASVLRGVHQNTADAAQVGEWTLSQTMAHLIGTAATTAVSERASTIRIVGQAPSESRPVTMSLERRVSAWRELLLRTFASVRRRSLAVR
jgi:hypothetical protein